MPRSSARCSLGLVLGIAATARAVPLKHIDAALQLMDPEHPPTPADRMLLPTDRGARCLDGSQAAIYVSKGADPSRWLIYHQGGGWCTDVASCCETAMTFFNNKRDGGVPVGDLTGLGGYFSRDPASNPLMHEWNFAYLPYCDGGSFAGARSEPLVSVCGDQGPPELHFAGSHIVHEAIQHLKTEHGLGRAKEVVIGGCSAGGLAVFLHADRWAAALPSVPRVVAMSDSGFFLDATNTSEASSLHPLPSVVSSLAAHASDVSAKTPRAAASSAPLDHIVKILSNGRGSAARAIPKLANFGTRAVPKLTNFGNGIMSFLRRRSRPSAEERYRRYYALKAAGKGTAVSAPAVSNPTDSTGARPQAGSSVAIGTGSDYTSQMKWLFKEMNATAGVDASCISYYRSPASAPHVGETWRCMFAQYAAPHVTTPTLLMQSAYDLWQTSEGSIIGTDVSARAKNDFGASLRGTIKATLLTQPQHATFIDACSRHCLPDTSSATCLWNQISVNGVTQDAALAAFLRPHAHAAGVAGAALGSVPRLWEQSDSYPCKECCLGTGAPGGGGAATVRPDTH